MRLELEKKQKKSDKQNTLHTYDGRLRLRESDEEGSVVDSGRMNTRLITYNPANNILYPTTTMQSTSGIAMNSHYTTNEIDDTSRNCAVASMAETPLDLHYAFRNDYSMDPTQANYSLIYPSSSYYSNSTPTAFTDFNTMGITNQSSLIPSYSNYTNNIPYSSLMTSVQTPTTVPITTNDGVSSCFISSGATNDCVHNGSLFDNHVTDDFLSINQTASSSKDKIIDQFSEKYNDYVNDSSKQLDVASVSAVDLNCLLNDENLAAHQIDSVPSSTNGSIGAVNSINSAVTSTEPHATSYMRFESDYANKLNATHNYSLSDESSTAVAANVIIDDKSNELFQKDSVLTT